MICRDVRDHLSPYLDEELDPMTSRATAEHLASCAGCAAAWSEALRLRAELRSGLAYHAAPDTLRLRVLRDRAAASPPAGRAPPRPAARVWRGMGAAAALMIVAGGAWLAGSLSPVSSTEAIARDVVASHVRSLMANHLTDVSSTDQHTVKPWFGGKLDFSPPVADFAAAGYPLIGGRLDYLQGRAVAALVYTHRMHVINVFVWPAADASETLAPALERHGYHVLDGTHAHMTYWLVSDLNAGELAQFARMLMPPAAGAPGSR
jgi:anti-sigma factor RsiW